MSKAVLPRPGWGPALMPKMFFPSVGPMIIQTWNPDYAAPEETLPENEMDPSQFDQILANLYVNARDVIAGVGKMTIGTQNVGLDEHDCATYPEVSPGR